ncbi:MAG: polymerase subunit alpha [Frankiales bacterium]|nr:polymerase subunit alpha [Frankiales bacterium]
MTDPFVHLHVASGYSLKHGASHPKQLVERAAEHGMDALALTDRDGAYGIVKFAQACESWGVRPIFGVDLAMAPVAPVIHGELAHFLRGPERGNSPPIKKSIKNRTVPARGGAFRLELRRVTFLARDGKGWAQLCRLISATHLAGERGQPVSSLDLVAEHASGGGIAVLLGPQSELGRALDRRRPDEAAAHLRTWRDVLGRDAVVVEVVHHRGPGDAARAARFLGFAHEQRATAVLSNVVRYADRADAPTADVLDASRRLVALDARHVDRANAEAALLSGKEMADVAEEVARYAGLRDEGRSLLAETRKQADRCAVDPRSDLGIGEVHFPELEVAGEASALLRERCEAGLNRRQMPRDTKTLQRLDEEFAVIEGLGFPSYFLTVADVVDLIKAAGVRVAARGSGAGSLVNYLLGISDVDPIRYGLLMERFLSPLRNQLPDIDIDVESARRTELYELILARYGGERCTCVSMMDTYRARHGIRDVGAALGLPPGDVDALAKAFPHIRASQVRQAMKDLPELRSSGLNTSRVDLVLQLVERLDGLPRHIALHPCGVLLSDRTLLDRTPVESSWLGFPMSQFDKDDVEALGLLKLDVLGIRMQSAMAHAMDEVERVEGTRPDVDSISREDLRTFHLVQSTKTLGCFQIESPGQRELIGKFAPETFEDLITDISLFRPGPVKSDMVRPFLEARNGWKEALYVHDDLREALEQTYGVVVFHEQVLMIVAKMTDCSLAEADEVRRALGNDDGQEEVRVWFRPTALGRGYSTEVVDEVWDILKAFGSFGFCKAHAAAFALPTYQSTWLKAHHPAAFLAGVLTHDPGMYPKRLILDDARQFGIAILSLDVNASQPAYTVEKVGFLDEPPPAILGAPPRSRADDLDLPDGRGHGIRIGLSDVRGITEAEIARIVAGRPFASLSDFWHRAAVSRPIVERLVVAGGFDSLYGLGSSIPGRRRGQVTRRDLLLQVAELDRWSRSVQRGQPKKRKADAPRAFDLDIPLDDVKGRQAKQSQRATVVEPVDMQLALDLGDAPEQTVPSGLPEMTQAERTRAELDVLGLDVSSHVLDGYRQFFAELGVTPAKDLLGCRSNQGVLVAGVKVATQTPPIRSGRRVVFVTLDDSTGPVDATFFEQAQVGYASTVFHSWLLVIRGEVRRTGPRGLSLLALGAWELPVLHAVWSHGGMDAVWEHMELPGVVTEQSVHGAAESRSTRPVMTRPPASAPVQVYPTGFKLSAYSDIKPAGTGVTRKLWHASPGSSGR